ncbi:hypothetical protein CAEBREN_28156 [Caenorhabditis brenneri]|uniref:Uncharacterized protein n=1 Tax=Caenorhabditis brenneri TaxID=135651 RepID=G0MK71_CAEBE|nr:hypothetical protein CAEBREN_28156 [Caenorhabditis brenneri]
MFSDSSTPSKCYEQFTQALNENKGIREKRKKEYSDKRDLDSNGYWYGLGKLLCTSFSPPPPPITLKTNELFSNFRFSNKNFQDLDNFNKIVAQIIEIITINIKYSLLH